MTKIRLLKGRVYTRDAATGKAVCYSRGDVFEIEGPADGYRAEPARYEVLDEAKGKKGSPAATTPKAETPTAGLTMRQRDATGRWCDVLEDGKPLNDRALRKVDAEALLASRQVANAQAAT